MIEHKSTVLCRHKLWIHVISQPHVTSQTHVTQDLSEQQIINLNSKPLSDILNNDTIHEKHVATSQG